MPSAELLPAAVLKRKAVVYIRATATSSDRTLLSTKGEPNSKEADRRSLCRVRT